MTRGDGTDPVGQIARAVLYEGYLLWPYRPSATKNRHRFTLGGLYPGAYAEHASDRRRASFEVLVEGAAPRLDVDVRYLHLVCGVAWDEAREEAVAAHGLTLDAPSCVSLAAGAGCDEERGPDGTVRVRTWDALAGDAEISASALGPGLRRVHVAVENASDAPEIARDDALRRTFLALHVVLRLRDGAFVSTVDPPAALAAEASACRSDGLWPVLVGTPGKRTTILAAPIILEEYPCVAPESSGDFFDGGEIDELLVHSIRALTDDEKREIRAADPRGRELLERAEALGRAELARLHGRLT